jgi:hypothetical protein
LADSGNWHTATNLFQLQREAYSRYWINSGKPIDGLSAAETCFSRFKEPVPFKI